MPPRILAMALSCLIALTSSWALAADSVLWMTYDSPPLIIRGGDLAGLGFGELQQRVLANYLPDFQHRARPAALDRLWHDMAERDGICTIGVIRTPERAQIYSFSNRPVRTPGWRLLVRQDHLAAIAAARDEEGEVDLDLLARNEQLRGGYVQARRYTPKIDQFIEHAAKMSGYAEAAQLFNLMKAGRIDYGIVLAVEMPYFARIFPVAATLLPIKGVPLHNDGFVACSRRFLGQKVVAEIDLLLRNDRIWAEYLEPLRPWFSADDFATALAAKPEY